MSTATARTAARSARTTVRPTPARVRVAPPGLSLVPQRRPRAARAPYALVVLGLLVVGLLGLLALNTLLAQGSFQVHRLQSANTDLSHQEQALREQVGAMQSPANLSAQATAMGMVPGGPPLFLRLQDGAVLGQPSTAKKSSVKPVTVPGTNVPLAALPDVPNAAGPAPLPEPGAAPGLQDPTPAQPSTPTTGGTTP